MGSTPQKTAALGPQEDMNEWMGSGTVVGNPTQSTTSAGVPACTFWIRTAKGTIDSRARAVEARIKINVYGDLVTPELMALLKPHAQVVVTGELMNRTFDRMITTEVRARGVRVTPSADPRTTADSSAADKDDPHAATAHIRTPRPR